jgi:hypothetical protein
MQSNPPPGWPRPPVGWSPPEGWSPGPGWPPPPPGWQFWIDGEQVQQQPPASPGWVPPPGAERSWRRTPILIAGSVLVTVIVAVAAFVVFLDRGSGNEAARCKPPAGARLPTAVDRWDPLPTGGSFNMIPVHAKVVLGLLRSVFP